MKNLVNNFRSQPLHNKVLAVVYLLIVLAMPFIIGMKPAQAQSGNVYAVPQAQAAGDTYEAVVLQVSRKEVEPSFQTRAAGAAAGSALGLALASRSGAQNRFAVNTVGVEIRLTLNFSHSILNCRARLRRRRCQQIVPASNDRLSICDHPHATPMHRCQLCVVAVPRMVGNQQGRGRCNVDAISIYT